MKSNLLVGFHADALLPSLPMEPKGVGAKNPHHDHHCDGVIGVLSHFYGDPCSLGKGAVLSVNFCRWVH